MKVRNTSFLEYSSTFHFHFYKDYKMDRKLVALLVAILIQSCSSALIFIEGIPVDKLTLLRAQVALEIWELDLMQNYNKTTVSLLNIRKNTDRVTETLQALSD
jgi:hypothetical protein